MPITEKERKYLKNKHRGGKNNSKGAIMKVSMLYTALRI